MKGLAMARVAPFFTILVLALASTTRAEAPSVESLLRHLGHEDGRVREEAANALLARGFGMIATLAAVSESEGPVVAREAETLRRILLLAHRLSKAPRDEAAFWMHLEDIHRLAPDRLRPTALRLVLVKPAHLQAVRDQREAAKAAVRTFCLEWNEMSAPGSAEEKRHAVLRKELESVGPAAAPHLMRVLDVHHSRAFFHMDERTGVTARMQVRAIFGLAFLEMREAIPYLLVHAGSMSPTAGGHAAAAFRKLTSGEVPPTWADEKALADAWRTHREEVPHGTRWATRALLDELHLDAAAEIVGIPFPVWKTVVMLPGAHVNRRKATIRRLELLTGRAADVDPAAPAEKRLAQVRALVARFEAEGFE
jgi:hypothetical protein